MNVQALLWKYAEGLCNSKEQAEVARLVSADAALRQDLAAIRETQYALKGMEPEQPSMHFVQQVMDKLPKSRFIAGPLIKPFWKKTFWIGLAASLTAVFFFPDNGSTANGPLSKYADELFSGVNGILEGIPPMVLQYFVLVNLVVLILAGLDKTLSLRKHMNFF